MARKKQTGGYLKGPSHARGGIAAVVAGQEPVELEGGEYIIKKSSVDKLGKSTLDQINKKGRIPTMATGGFADSIKTAKKAPITSKKRIFKKKVSKKRKKSLEDPKMDAYTDSRRKEKLN